VKLVNLLVPSNEVIDEKRSSTISRYIKESIDAGVIAPVDANAGRKFMKYVPWWAAPGMTSPTP
jgi:hypothetical protein